MTWTAHLVQTQTGSLGAELRMTDAGGWDIPLNGIESFDVTVQRGQLRLVDASWWFPIRGSILISWRSEGSGKLTPWLMGPIKNLPEEDKDADTGKFNCEGIGALLADRILMDQDYGAPRGGSRIQAMVDLAHSLFTRTGMSLGTIAQEIVTAVTDNKLGGQLPISFGTPRETGSTLNQREYYGYNIANNDAWKLITALTNVINGPDIMFRPRFTDEAQTHVEWQMVHGTVAQHSIYQPWTMDLDTTSPRSSVSSIQPQNDSSALSNRVWWSGAGEDAGTLIRVVQNDRSLSSGMPLIEKVGNSNDVDNPLLIESRAESALDEGRAPLQQLTAVMDGADPRSEIGRWYVGDLANVTVGNDWLTVRPGTRPYKIIAAKGGWDQIVTLEFQEAQL